MRIFQLNYSLDDMGFHDDVTVIEYLVWINDYPQYIYSVIIRKFRGNVYVKEYPRIKRSSLDRILQRYDKTLDTMMLVYEIKDPSEELPVM